MASTLHDVARQAGVSIKTVSNVVNGHPHVRPSTRERVLAAIADLDYHPNPSARSLRSGRSGVLGFAVPNLRLPYFAELAGDVIAAAEQRGLTVLIEQTGADRSREASVLANRRRMLDGLLFSPSALGMDDVHLLRTDLPLVLLGEQIFSSEVDHVTMKNVEGARLATEHLLALGRRRIAVVGPRSRDGLGTTGLRLQGYHQALGAAGLPIDDRLLAPAGLGFRRQGAEAMKVILERDPGIDAVFAFNDTLALGVIHQLQHSGRKVPDDVAVIGFDNSDEGMYSLPALTTVDPDRPAIASIAVDTLLARIGDPERPTRLVEVDVKIVVRESTGRLDSDLGPDQGGLTTL